MIKARILFLRIPLILLIKMVVFGTSYGGFQYFGADFESANWQSSGNRLECRLSQQIPGYGQALFKHRATRPMAFEVSARISPKRASQALLFIQPPNYARYGNRKSLGRVPINSSGATIFLPQDWANRMALELREGMEAVWSHPDWADGTELVTAKIIPWRFDAAWNDFESCRQNLIDYDYGDVRYKEFYFKPNSYRFSRQEKAYLDQLAEYVSLDPDFEYIDIKSFSDSRGLRRINFEVTRKRANLVKSYLVKRGVNPKKFNIDARGELKPKYNNRTSAGRAKNRRVEITLVK